MTRRLGACAFPAMLAFTLAACSSPAPAPVPPSPPPAAPAAAVDEATPPSPSPQAGATTAHLRVVDGEGRPLEGMAPIVTRQPNAFDQPIAMGKLTAVDGTGTVQAPANEHLYLRAWDPELKRFAMNYFDLLPSAGGDTEEMTIQMREASTVRARLVRADGSPIAVQEIGAMLVHPKAGPWWPAAAQSDAEGVAVLSPLPPGQFDLQIGPIEAEPMVVKALLLPPGETADAGTITLP